LETHQPTTLTI